MADSITSYYPGKINRHDGHNESTAAWLFNESGAVIFTANFFFGKEIAVANANRIEKLWNAMVGIEDPEKFVDEYRNMLSVLKTQSTVSVVLADTIKASIEAAEATIKPKENEKQRQTLP